jgi:TRAP-type C4-dicarboxylate transport system permease small subunit
MERFFRFNAALEQICGVAAALCLFVFTIIVAIDVFFRQVIATPLLWPSEISVSLFVWSVLLGAAVCTRRNSHLVVEILPSMPTHIDRLLRLLVDLLCLIFALLVLWTGVKQAWAGVSRYTPMMGYPLWPFLVALPAAAVPMVLFSIERLVRGSPPGSAGGATAGEEGSAA